MNVSAIIIAKDEAAVIARATASILPGVAEVLVYDTGSTDGTRELAAKAGARVETDGPWEKWHFAKARNRAAALAKHPWLFVLDADEVVREGAAGISNAAQTAEETGATCIAVRFRMLEEGKGIYRDLTPRLYRRDAWAYRYRVHNVLAPAGPQAGAPQSTKRAVAQDIEIEHIIDPVKRPTRWNQTTALLEEAALEEPDHYEVHRYLADIYLTNGAYDQAAQAARRYIRAAKGKATPLNVSEGWLHLARALGHLGEQKEAFTAFEAAAGVCRRREPFWEAAQLAGRGGDWETAAAYMRRVCAVPRQAMPKYSPFTWAPIWGPLAEEALARFTQAAETIRRRAAIQRG